jgi:polyketide cyclase/dehydrase/lipid transport protein
MGELRYGESDVIGVPVDELYDYRLDFGRTLPEYNPNVTNMRRTDGGSDPGPGASYLFTLTMPGMGEMEVVLTVLDAERPGMILHETGQPGLMVKEWTRFETENGGTRIELEVVMPLPDGIPEDQAAFFEQGGREQMRLELENLKEAFGA